MDYLAILICISIIVFSFLGFGVFFRKRASATFLLSVCCMTLVIEAVCFSFFPLPSFYLDPVRITALGTCNEEARSSEVFLKSVSIHQSNIPFPEIEEGNWFWLNGMYCWKPLSNVSQPGGTTDSVVLKVPVGVQRALVFSGHRWRGLAEISLMDYSNTVDLYSETTTDITISLPNSSRDVIVKDKVLRIAIFMVIHCFILTGAVLVNRLFLRRCLNVLHRYNYESVCFLFSLLMIIKNTSFPNVSQYPSAFYLNSYEFGFMKRGLIGELAVNIRPYLDAEILAYFKLLFLLFFYFLASVLIGKIVRHQKDEKIRWFFVLLVCSLPNAFIFVLDDLRPDIYVTMLFAVCVVLLAKDNLLWMIPILTVFFLLINETSCTFFVPPLLSMLAYKYVKLKDKRYLLTASTSMVFTVVFAARFLFGEDPRSVYDLSRVLSHISNHASFPLQQNAIEAQMWTISRQLQNMSVNMAKHLRQNAVFFLYLIPISILLGILWRTLYRRWRQTETASKMQKLAVWGIMLSSLLSFSAMVISFDYPRYCSFMLQSFIATIFFFMYEENIQLNYSLDLWIDCTDAAPENVVPIGICIFYLLFGVFASTAYSTETISKTVSVLQEFFGI